MKFRCVSLGLLIFVTAAAQSQSTPVCVTHFYNQSNFKWSIYNFDGKKSSLFIAPNTTAAISWGATTVVTISGNIPGKPYVQQFQVQPANSCVVIQPQITTGPAAVNKPGNGDIKTCAGGC
jgi:hypothetical protein